jgi:hypothetical protein
MNRSPDTTELSRVGLDSTPTPEERQQLLLYITLRLRYLGCPTFPIEHRGAGLLDNLTSGLVALSREKDRLLSHHLCPVDQRAAQVDIPPTNMVSS